MKSAAAREARQVGRIRYVGPPGAEIHVDRPSKRTYDRFSHRERGRARARWRAEIAAKKPELMSRRASRVFRGAIRTLYEQGYFGRGTLCGV
jgi:hypothetical protein